MPVDRYINSGSNYIHPNESNLLNIHKAMQYRLDTLEPEVRVNIGSAFTISGTVNIPGTVNVASSSTDPVHVHITEIGTSGILGVPYMPVYGTVTATQGTTPWIITGTVGVNNFPTAFITSNFTSTVNVATVPVTTVTQGTTPWVITGSISVINGQIVVTNFTSTVNIASLPSITGTVVVSNFTSTVNIASMPAVSGTVAVSSLPVITGTVSVSNFTSTVFVSNTLTISNTSIAVTNFPTTSTVYQGTNPWNITGTVAISSLPEVEIKNDSGNPIPVSGTVNATLTGTNTFTLGTGSTDAFGRLRVSEAFTLGDYKHTYGIDPNFRDTYTNGGTVTHISNQAAARLATTNNANSRAIHQTKMYHNYMPGKSQLIKSTINFYSATTNVTKRTGYYDDLNGIYFEQNGAGVLSFVIRTDTSGTASDARRVIQSDWNKDKCDGTGASGFNLDITKTQIFFIDFQWLGVGRVRCGFVHNGQTIIAHEFYNSNNLPTVYMSNPNLPIRCEILNTGATTGAFFDQICSTVVSEGGYVESGIDFSIDSGQTSQSITVANGMYPVVAIRLKNTFRGYPNRVVVRSGNINVYAEEYPAYWALFKLSDLSAITLSSSTWTSANADSAVEYNLTATAFTGGDRIDGGIVGTTSPGGSAKGTGTAPVNHPSNAKKNFIAQNQNSTDSEIYVVCGKAIGGTSKLWIDFQWREIY